MRLFLILTVFALATCGADGDPEPVQGGITIGGEVGIGVRGTL
ncbi:MAG: argininosuccinate lyase [Boseongicola sp.]|nr:argininosuccinate lyase [Boseongicola sp.]